MKVVGFLQNAWSPLYAGDIWPRDSWLRALKRSRTGQRLQVLETAAPGVEFWWDNTTPIVGDSPNSVVPPDHDHMINVLLEQEPTTVIAFGKQAGVIRSIWQSSLVLAPHPAYRLVTNKLYKAVGKLLLKGVDGVVELRQERGRVSRVALSL